MAWPGKQHVYADKQQLCEAAAQDWVKLARQAVQQRGRCNIALSGGNTPADLFRVLTSDGYRNQLDWSTCHFYFGDERYVPHQHEQSNYRMARECLFEPLSINNSQIHPIPTALPAAQCAEEYQRLLLRSLPLQSGVPVFDLMLLGMGPDGHTASLFPGTTALEETQRACVDVQVPQLNTTRITLTYPVINSARYLMLLIAGAEKADMLLQIFSNVLKDPVPIQKLTPSGEMHWYLDQAAVDKLG